MPIPSVASLYRTYLRQIRQLPHLYLRQFFRIKAADDIRAALYSEQGRLRDRKIKRLSKDVRRLEAANKGSVDAFTSLLDVAYGRKGKLRWEIMKPLLSDPNAPVPPRIIPQTEKSRPPVYSPELKALLTSPYSRTTKPLSAKALEWPTTLPTRADPASEEARLLGPFSKRREVNIRWRYFVEEWKKVKPPLQVVILETIDGQSMKAASGETLKHVGVRGVGLQGSAVFENVEAIAGPSRLSPTPTRKERQGIRNAEVSLMTGKPVHPSRWVRRRYQGLLTRLPVLQYSRFVNSKTGRDSGSYSVGLTQVALGASDPHSPFRLSEMDSDNLAWYGINNIQDGRSSPGARSRKVHQAR